MTARTPRSLRTRSLVAGTLALGTALVGVVPASATTLSGSLPESRSVSELESAPEAETGASGAPVGGSTEIASSLAQPSLALLTVGVNAWVVTPAGGYPQQTEFTCTGFVVDSDGYLATAGHCVDVSPGSDIDVELRSNTVEDMLSQGVTCGGVPCTEDALLAEAVDFAVEGGVAGSEPEVTVTVYLDDVLEGATARMVDVQAFDDGDVALLSVEADDLPVLELDDREPSIGTDLVSIGYPGATMKFTTEPVPEFKPGMVTSLSQDRGGAPFIGVSSGNDHGMSGGPAVNLDGTVMGVISMGVGSHNFVTPVSELQKLLSRNDIDGELSDVDASYRDAFAAYAEGDVRLAEQLFADVVAARPDDDEAKRWQDRMAASVAELPAESVSSEVPGDGPERTTTRGDGDAGESGLRAVLAAGLAAAALVAAGLGIALARTFRRPTAVTAVGPAPSAWFAQPGQPYAAQPSAANPAGQPVAAGSGRTF